MTSSKYTTKKVNLYIYVTERSPQIGMVAICFACWGMLIYAAMSGKRKSFPLSLPESHFQYLCHVTVTNLYTQKILIKVKMENILKEWIQAIDSLYDFTIIIKSWYFKNSYLIIIVQMWEEFLSIFRSSILNKDLLFCVNPYIRH